MFELPARHIVAQNVSLALLEDIGAKDWTGHLIEPTVYAQAEIITREATVICGQAWAEECFRQVEPTISVKWHQPEGAFIEPNTRLCEIAGPAHALLTAERSALNFLQLLSGVASKTKRYVDAVRGTQTHIVDTRKTIPGLRLAQKYAVCVGGGKNQRMGLYDGILIKENHIIAARGLTEAVAQARYLAPSHLPIQVEVETLAQLDEALRAEVNLILLDNMQASEITEAVKRTAGRACLEASGGVDLAKVRALAETGIDRISIGKLTKDIIAIDFSMRFI